MGNEKISVIIPVYNVEKYIRKCIESVCGQTYRNLEIILIDDGSPDKSGAICDEYAATDSRIKVIHTENGGVSRARNIGLDMATGKYIGFIDSDDYIKPGMYETLACRMEKEDADTAICGFISVNEEGEVLPDKQIPMPANDMVMTREEAVRQLAGSDYVCFITVTNRLYRKEVFQKIRFPEKKRYEDEYIAHHVLWKCRKVIVLNEPQYYYVHHSDSFMEQEYALIRIDCADAWLERAQFAHENNIDELLAYSCKKAMNLIGVGYQKLDRRRPEVSEKIKQLRHKTMKFYPKVLFSRASAKDKISFTLFMLHIKCYVFIKDKCYLTAKDYLLNSKKSKSVLGVNGRYGQK